MDSEFRLSQQPNPDNITDGPSKLLLRVQGISKRFTGVVALDQVDFELRRGEVHALIGENGAGKSTLVKILAGAHQPDSGTIEISGKQVHISNPHDSLNLGIAFIFQELSVVNGLSVAENIMIGQERRKGVFFDFQQARSGALEVLSQIGFDNLKPNDLVKTLSVAEKQGVMIARALYLNAQVVVMDEASKASVYRALALFGLVSILLFALVKVITSTLDNPFNMVWHSLGNLVQFETAKLAFYVPYFGLGVYAYSRTWFVSGKDFGRPWVWGLICFLLMVVNMPVGRSMTRAADPSAVLQLAFVVLYPLWTLSFLGMFTAFASRRWNYATPLGKELAANSYSMYLVHYVFVMTLPLLLGVWAGGPALVKFGIVALMTVVLSYGISKYAINRYPHFVVVGLVGLNILLAVVI